MVFRAEHTNLLPPFVPHLYAAIALVASPAHVPVVATCPRPVPLAATAPPAVAPRPSAST